MDINKRIAVENEMLDMAFFVLKTWDDKLRELNISVSPLSINRSNSADDYFSEIEFDFWRNNDLLNCFSIIIYLEGKQAVSVEEAYKELNGEIKASCEEAI